MPLPGFLGPHIKVALATASVAGGAAPGSSKLSFAIQPQQQPNWCWAAVSTSVSHFYTAASAWTQCLVANQALPRPDCCAGGAADPARCNKPWYLDIALQVTSTLRQNVVQRALTFAEIQTEIGRDAPIGCRVGWDGGGGHFLVVAGWLVGDSGTEYIDVSDPIYLDSQIAYDDFAASYQAGGDWTHSYLTHAPAAGGVEMAMATMGMRVTGDPDAIGA